MPTALTFEELRAVLVRAGFVDEALVVAAATAYAESRLVPTEISTNRNGSRDRGLFQINDRAWPNITDAEAMDPAFSAHWAYQVTHAGADWHYWSTHTVQDSNHYSNYLHLFEAWGKEGGRPVGNDKLADAAEAGVTDPAFVDTPGRCEQYAREIIQSVYGSRYDDIYRATAAETGRAWADAGYAVQGDLQRGDVLFKTTFTPGHVGIYVGDPHGVAENSSTRIGRVQGAKGYRNLEQFGHFEIVVRLPEPAVIHALVLHGQAIAHMRFENGINLCPLREFAAAMAFDLEGDDQKGFTFDGKPVPGLPITEIAGHAYAPIRALAASCGLDVEGVGDGSVVIGKAGS